MSAFGAKRTSLERRDSADLTKMTHSGHRPDRNPAVQRSALRPRVLSFKSGAQGGLVKGQLLGLKGFAFGGTRIEIGERLAGRIADHVAARKFLFAPRRGKASSHCCPLHAVRLKRNRTNESAAFIFGNSPIYASTENDSRGPLEFRQSAFGSATCLGFLGRGLAGSRRLVNSKVSQLCTRFQLLP